MADLKLWVPTNFVGKDLQQYEPSLVYQRERNRQDTITEAKRKGSRYDCRFGVNATYLPVADEFMNTL